MSDFRNKAFVVAFIGLCHFVASDPNVQFVCDLMEVVEDWTIDPAAVCWLTPYLQCSQNTVITIEQTFSTLGYTDLSLSFEWHTNKPNEDVLEVSYKCGIEIDFTSASTFQTDHSSTPTTISTFDAFPADCDNSDITIQFKHLGNAQSPLYNACFTGTGPPLPTPMPTAPPTTTPTMAPSMMPTESPLYNLDIECDEMSSTDAWTFTGPEVCAVSASNGELYFNCYAGANIGFERTFSTVGYTDIGLTFTWWANWPDTLLLNVFYKCAGLDIFNLLDGYTSQPDGSDTGEDVKYYDFPDACDDSEIVIKFVQLAHQISVDNVCINGLEHKQDLICDAMDALTDWTFTGGNCDLASGDGKDYIECEADKEIILERTFSTVGYNTVGLNFDWNANVLGNSLGLAYQCGGSGAFVDVGTYAMDVANQWETDVHYAFGADCDDSDLTIQLTQFDIGQVAIDNVCVDGYQNPTVSPTADPTNAPSVSPTISLPEEQIICDPMDSVDSWTITGGSCMSGTEGGIMCESDTDGDMSIEHSVAIPEYTFDTIAMSFDWKSSVAKQPWTLAFCFKCGTEADYICYSGASWEHPLVDTWETQHLDSFSCFGSPLFMKFDIDYGQVTIDNVCFWGERFPTASPTNHLVETTYDQGPEDNSGAEKLKQIGGFALFIVILIIFQ